METHTGNKLILKWFHHLHAQPLFHHKKSLRTFRKIRYQRLQCRTMQSHHIPTLQEMNENFIISSVECICEFTKDRSVKCTAESSRRTHGKCRMHGFSKDKSRSFFMQSKAISVEWNFLSRIWCDLFINSVSYLPPSPLTIPIVQKRLVYNTCSVANLIELNLLTNI